MKVTCLLGSPRLKGNSARIAGRFLDTAEQLGADVKLFKLNQMNFRGCQGCDVCKTKQDYCVLEDDLTPALEAVKQTDVLVLATPVYYMDVTSQLKAFIDRTYSFVDADFKTNPNASRLTKGKKLVFIQTQDESNGAFGEIFDRYSMVFHFYGFDEIKRIWGIGIGQTSDMDNHTDIMKEAEQIAHQFCEA